MLLQELVLDPAMFQENPDSSESILLYDNGANGTRKALKPFSLACCPLNEIIKRRAMILLKIWYRLCLSVSFLCWAFSHRVTHYFVEFCRNRLLGTCVLDTFPQIYAPICWILTQFWVVVSTALAHNLDHTITLQYPSDLLECQTRRLWPPVYCWNAAACLCWWSGNGIASSWRRRPGDCCDLPTTARGYWYNEGAGCKMEWVLGSRITHSTGIFNRLELFDQRSQAGFEYPPRGALRCASGKGWGGRRFKSWWEHLVEQLEALRYKLLRKALEENPDQNARPARVFKNISDDKCAGRWLLAPPSPDLSMSKAVFHEALSAHICLPSQVGRAFVP